MKASLRLHFRDLTTKDTSALIEIYSDVEAMKFRANPPVLSTEDALIMIQQAEQEGKQFTSKRWGLVLKETKELIGTFVLNYDKAQPICTIGYSIGKKFWHKGYGKELLEAMLKEVKSTATLLWKQAKNSTIKAYVHPQNIASIAILEKQHFYQVDADLAKNLLTYSLEIRL